MVVKPSMRILKHRTSVYQKRPKKIKSREAEGKSQPPFQKTLTREDGTRTQLSIKEHAVGGKGGRQSFQEHLKKTSKETEGEFAIRS